LERHRTESTERGDTFNEVQGRYYAIGAEVARVEQAIQHVQDRAQELQQDLTLTERNFVESEEHLRVDRQKAQSWDAELQEISPELEKVVVAEELSQAALQQAEEVMQSWQASWDDFNHTAAEPRQQAEVQQSRIQHLEQVLRRLVERIESIQSEHQELSDSSVQEDITLLQEQLTEVELASSDKKTHLDTITEPMDSARQRGKLANTELDKSRTNIQTMIGRKASLEALQQAALSGEGDQQQWLESNQLNGQPRLAETLQVDPGWETAVETVLGSYLQAVCVESFGDLSHQLDTFTKGELVLIDKAQDLDVSNASAEVLSKKVSGDYAAVMLSGIYAVDDLKAALAIRKNLAAGQ